MKTMGGKVSNDKVLLLCTLLHLKNETIWREFSPLLFPTLPIKSKIYLNFLLRSANFVQESSFTFCLLLWEIEGALVAFTFASVASSDL